MLMRRVIIDLLYLRVGDADRDSLGGDRKSTRLNSSHGYISYAVFCLKKKKNKSLTRGNQQRKSVVSTMCKGRVSIVLETIDRFTFGRIRRQKCATTATRTPYARSTAT